MTHYNAARKQAIMARIDAGHRNKDIAEDFGVSAARISQYRTERPRRDVSRRIIVGYAAWKELCAAAEELGAEPAEFAGRLLKVALARRETV